MGDPVDHSERRVEADGPAALCLRQSAASSSAVHVVVRLSVLEELVVQLAQCASAEE
jgi:hypothetical protein